MIKVANILNKTFCKECTGQRVTLVHLDTEYNISIRNLDIEKDLRMMMTLCVLVMGCPVLKIYVAYNFTLHFEISSTLIIIVFLALI